MSHLADLLAPKLPAGMTIPEPLERAWTSMEEQGWGFENRHGYFLTPYAGTTQLGIVFSPTESLTGWFEPGEPGHDRLFPLGQTDGTGSFAALWLDPSDVIRFVMLGSEGERLSLADDAVDFLRLLAVGYLELNDYALPEEPSEEDEESVAALAPFRAWVETEFGVEVPAQWEVREPDPFDAWVAEVKNEEPEPVRAATAFVAPEVNTSEVIAACLDLFDEPRIEGIQFGRLRGFRRTTAAWGHELLVIETKEPGNSTDVATLARLMSDVRAAFAARWGPPRAEAPAAGSWAANKMEVTWIQHVDLWPVTDDVVVALFTSAEEGLQIAAVVSPAAIDAKERF
ncbi:hypothetical protein [Pseudoclavibacter terrae]|uniref:hypothetical protein n=1 Tax=Pseudoclavibacter terrae TaxID=1530195 RepID=UPI001AD7A0ED|nr:hypothetical protein [Pseudoclavibacter terrae]